LPGSRLDFGLDGLDPGSGDHITRRLLPTAGCLAVDKDSLVAEALANLADSPSMDAEKARDLRCTNNSDQRIGVGALARSGHSR
jgi:hypothetical protein